ncbi:MAG TPA: CHASE3 domain-containing protein [Candidatus Binatia bacterium]|nr:CHASE3 domain-containing protein [Candidatus Binatia bacterium]
MLWTAFGGLLLLSAVDYWTTNRFLWTTEQAEHAHEVVERLDRLLADVTDAETGQRGYLITGAPRYLEPYARATGHVTGAMEALRLATAGDRRQRSRVAHLEHLVRTRLGILKETLDLRTESGFEAARRRVLMDTGKNVMDATRRCVATMMSWERAVLVRRSHEVRNVAARTMGVLLLGDVGSLALVSLALMIALHGLADRRRQTTDAQAASRFKSWFVASVSHELRTPLTVLLGYTELLSDPGTSRDEASRYVSIVHRNADHMLGVLNDLLDLSRIEAGRLTTERVACSPFELAEDVAALMRRRAEDKGLEFQTRYHGPLPERITTDPFRVRQILINLVNNAIKFTDAGTVRVDVSLAADQLEFAVTDTGTGISPENEGALFRAFTQAGGTDTERIGGSGLGLAISKELARLLNGDLVFQRPAGCGSRFVLTIDPGRIDTALTAATPRPAHDSMIDAAAAIQLAGRVLVAEDDADTRELLALHLRAAGADVTVAADGAEACALTTAAAAAGTPFDLILMDMQMPNLDGYAATRRLRALGHRGGIVALSAHVLAADRERCLEVGCDEFAGKPIGRHVLLATAKRFLARPHPHGEPLLSSFADDREIAPALGAFVGRLPTRIAAMEDAVAMRNLDAVADLAHQLKGAAKGYGFASITEAAAALEAAAQQQGDVDRRLAELAGLCRRARAAAGETAS